MNHYVVVKEDIELIRFVLERDEIPYHCAKEGKTYVISTALTKNEFAIVLEDVACERQRCNSLSRIPVYSLNTFKNKKKLKRLMRINHCNCHRILEKDEKEFEALSTAFS